MHSTPYKTGCHTFRLSRATSIRSFQKHTFYKTILGSFLDNGLKTNSKNSKENINQRENR